MMTISDILIIYFSFGAPFAVYQFIHQPQTSTLRVVFDTAANFLFWMPLLARLGFNSIANSSTSVDFADVNDPDSHWTADLRSMQTTIVDHFRTEPRRISVHKFRELLDRYVGLSQLIRQMSSSTNEPQYEVFFVASHQNVRLASICFERRNRARLNRHHNDAREDLFEVIGECWHLDKRLLLPVIQLVRVLEDVPTSLELLRSVGVSSPNVHEMRESGVDLWLPEIQSGSAGKELTVMR